MNLTRTASALVFAVLCVSVSGIKWNKVFVKYAVIGGYWRMPVTVAEIKNQFIPMFVKVGHDSTLNVDLYSHRNDPRFFLLFDTYGNIAGIRTGYIKSDIPKAAIRNGLTMLYDYSKISMFESGTFWDINIWYTNILFVDPDKLSAGGRENTNGLVAEGVYVKLDGAWVNVSRNECQVEKQNFTKQACFPGMGQHYFYKTTPTLQCNETQPFFALYDQGDLIGFGLVPYGSFTHKLFGQQWFENVPRIAAQLIMPNGPQCSYEWTDKFQLTSIHVFFKEHARFTMCPLFGSTQCSK